MASPSSIITFGLGAWGSPADVVTLGYGISTETLIGRKYPRRRGKTRARQTDDVEIIIPKTPRKVSREKEILEVELAEAKADLVTTELMAHNSVNRAEKIQALSRNIEILEGNLQRVREEEVLIMLAFMALEME